MKTIAAILTAALIVCVAVMINYEKQLDRQPRNPLILHTISKGGSAKVVYLERWHNATDMTACTDFEIVWPAGANQGYIDYMVEHARGKIRHEFRQVGWWKDGEVFLPITD